MDGGGGVADLNRGAVTRKVGETIEDEIRMVYFVKYILSIIVKLLPTLMCKVYVIFN
ncbi:hypothetical protein Hanom_Chr05g00443691 [Helianthus anomalus]